MAKKPIYKVMFINHDKTYELYAKEVYNSDIYGFIEVEAFIFNERGQKIVNPCEERLKKEFEGVVRSYIPMHMVIRIDEVAKEGVGKISDVKDNNKVTAFPLASEIQPV